MVATKSHIRHFLLLGRFQGGQLPPSRELPLIGLDWKEAERREAEAEDKKREKEKEEEEAEEEWGQEVDPKRTPRWPPPSNIRCGGTTTCATSPTPWTTTG